MARALLVRGGVAVFADGEQVERVLRAEVRLVVERADRGHPVRVEVPRALLDDALVGFVDQERDGLHEVADDDEILGVEIVVVDAHAAAVDILVK